MSSSRTICSAGRLPGCSSISRVNSSGQYEKQSNVWAPRRMFEIRCNDAPFSTDGEGDFNLIALMEAASCFILSSAASARAAHQAWVVGAKGRRVKMGPGSRARCAPLRDDAT